MYISLLHGRFAVHLFRLTMMIRRLIHEQGKKAHDMETQTSQQKDCKVFFLTRFSFPFSDTFYFLRLKRVLDNNG